MNSEVHLHKYEQFKKEAEKADYPPSAIENYFLSAFHLIEAFSFFKLKVHIQKHSLVRRALEENLGIFGDKTENIWKLFEELENKVRIATSYGKRENESFDKGAMRRSILSKTLFEGFDSHMERGLSKPSNGEMKAWASKMRVLINQLSVILDQCKTLFEGLIVIRGRVCQSPQILESLEKLCGDLLATAKRV